MNNINFSNPWLLLIGLGLFAIILIPFFIAIRKERFNFHNVTSLVLHLLIASFVTLTCAHMTYQKVITETNVYVIADVSYSAHNNYELINQYVEKVEGNLPKNSKMGVVTFAKEPYLLTDLDGKFDGVEPALEHVDQSETNIADALNYTKTLFNDDVIKRIVLISDGAETNSENIVNIVNDLINDGIYIDAIYLDDNLPESIHEVQLNQLDVANSAFLNHETTGSVLIQTNYDTRSILKLYQDDVLADEIPVNLNKGLNVANFTLDTSHAGNSEYYVEITVDEDDNSYNNKISFDFEVIEKAKILCISDNSKDKTKIEELYGETCDIDYYINNYNVPYTLESLCQYDEFILSNIDVRLLENASAFMNNLDLSVAKYGKSLITLGDTYIQNNEDENLDKLSAMLPVKYGNDDSDTKTVAVVIDVSLSMENISHLKMAKQAAAALVDLLKDEDKITVIAFDGDVKIALEPTYIKDNRDAIKKMIEDLQTAQGTFLATALKATYNVLVSTVSTLKQVFLISDGIQSKGEEANARTVANDMLKKGIILSSIYTNSTEGYNSTLPDNSTAIRLLKELASITGGYFYNAANEEEMNNLMLSDVANDVTETVIEGAAYELSINNKKDGSVEDIENLPDIWGFYFAKKKASASMVLSTVYTSASRREHEVPVYSYWSYGNGRVSTFTSDISSYWVTRSFYVEETGKQFFKNVVISNAPKERVNTPFLFSTKTEGTYSYLYIDAAYKNYFANLEFFVTTPTKEKATLTMAFDGEKYSAMIETSDIGLYQVDLIYTLGEEVYNSTYTFNISYVPEYNSFTRFEASSLNYMISQNGTVSEDGNLDLTNNNSVIITYKYDFTILFMAIVGGLFLVDIIIRKLTLADIKSLFKKTK